MEQQLEVQGFDYNVVKPENREEARSLAVEGRKRVRRTKEELLALRDVLWKARPLIPYGYWELWVQEEIGLANAHHAYQIMHPKLTQQEIIINDDLPQLPEPSQSQVDEKDRKLTEIEEKLRIANERLFSVEGREAYYKEQALIAQAQAAQPRQPIEKRVEVIPQHILDRQKELQERLRALQTEKTQIQSEAVIIKKERDLYKHDLEKQRQAGNNLFLQRLEHEGAARKQANFAEAMREIVAWCGASRMKLPSVVDTQVFEAEQWQRLMEALAAIDILSRDLRNIKQTVSSSPQQSPLIVDAEVEVYS